MARGGVKKKEFISGIELENRSRISRAGNANERIKDTLTVTKKKKKKAFYGLIKGRGRESTYELQDRSWKITQTEIQLKKKKVWGGHKKEPPRIVGLYQMNYHLCNGILTRRESDAEELLEEKFPNTI